MKKNTHDRILKMVGIGIFSAIVVVLQLLGSFIKLGPFSISLVLIPIVVGSAVYGKGAGTWLGFLFGVVVLLSGDAAAFLSVNFVGTIITVLVKGTLAGLVVDVVYSLLSKINKYLAVFVSAALCPIVNTGVFLLGCKVFFMDTIAQWSAGSEYGSDVVSYMFLGLAGGNFLCELFINIIMSPITVRIVNIGLSHGKHAKSGDAASVDIDRTFVMAVVGLVLGFTCACTIAGIVLCDLASGNMKDYFANGGADEGKAKVTKILSEIGFWISMAFTALFAVAVALLLVF